MAKRRPKGDGTVYLNDQNNRWIAQVTLPNGKRKSKSFKKQREAIDWKIEQLGRLHEGIYVADDKLRLDKFLDRTCKMWLKTHFGREATKDTTH